MPWGQFILAITKIAGSLARWAESRQLISAGEAKAIGQATHENLEFMRRVNRARGTDDAEWMRRIDEAQNRDNRL